MKRGAPPAVWLLFGGSVGLLIGSLGWTVSQSARALRHADTAHGHGGSVQPVGDHHVEALMEKDGRLRVYVLGRDARELTPIAAAALTAQLQCPGETACTRLSLRADPEPGEPAGRSSQFAGTLPQGLLDRPVAVALNVPLEGRRFRIRYAVAAPHSAGTEHAEAPGPPAWPAAGGASHEEQELYQRPRGRYTAGDIAANGPRLPSQRFRGVIARHNAKPAVGARICPITKTAADARFTWIIGAKAYQFCCPPCIDEFVRQAKENPESIRPPEAYVKR